MASGIPARLSPAEGRRFGLTVGGAFLLLAALFFWRDRDSLGLAALLPGASLLVAGVLFPTRLGPVQSAWMRMAHAISRVTTPIFMGVVFFLVITPIGFAMRRLGHRPLVRRRGQSAWLPRAAPTDRRSDLHRQF